MSHSINYAVYDRSVSRKAVLAEIQEEVTYESWREGGEPSGHFPKVL